MTDIRNMDMEDGDFDYDCTDAVGGRACPARITTWVRFTVHIVLVIIPRRRVIDNTLTNILLLALLIFVRDFFECRTP